MSKTPKEELKIKFRQVIENAKVQGKFFKDGKKFIEDFISSLPDNYEPVPKEVKLSEILGLFEEIYSGIEVSRLKNKVYFVVYDTYLERNIDLIWFDNNLISGINSEAMEDENLKRLYMYWFNQTTIIDDLKENNND